MATIEGNATPLCLPNNCLWNERTGKCRPNSELRNSLYVVDKALHQLRKIKGPVCVVTIVGPCREGKSYILSKAFDQGEIFPLGSSMDPETMGIWMKVVPEKIKDSNGQEFTVVLLDSEGIDAVTANGSDDHCIFTLITLLASVLIYNSVGVPSRNDLDGLDFIAKLSQRIQLRSTDQRGKKAQEDAKSFVKTFPYFIWLLRDAGLPLPKDCSNIRDYFLKRVFKSEPCSHGDNAGKVAESILNFFPGFDAFKLPSPSLSQEVLLNLNREDVQHDINKEFVRGVQEFKAMLLSKLCPKRSFQDGEYVTGEALASLLITYVEALNTPGMVPSVQSAWEAFVTTKCTEAKCAAEQVYDKTMSTQLDKCQLPCDSDDIKKMQNNAVEKSMAVFEAEIVGVSSLSGDKYREELKGYMEDKLEALQERNNNLTREECDALQKRLKEERVDPIIAMLYTEGGSSVSVADIVSGYSAIEEDFKSQSRGAKDVCAQVFYEFHPELKKEMKKNMDHLQQLKDNDEKLAKERKEREKERKRNEAQREKDEEDRKRLQEQLREAQRSQTELSQTFLNTFRGVSPMMEMRMGAGNAATFQITLTSEDLRRLYSWFRS